MVKDRDNGPSFLSRQIKPLAAPGRSEEQGEVGGGWNE